MFAYSGLNKEQVTKLQDTHHIYCTMDGRISMAVNSDNVDYICNSIHDVSDKVSVPFLIMCVKYIRVGPAVFFERLRSTGGIPAMPSAINRSCCSLSEEVMWLPACVKR
jgi:hypothetical protein